MIYAIVSRTAIIPLENQIKIIKSHSTLEPLDIQGLFDANLKFHNQFNQEIRNVVIEDIIPMSYIYNVYKPEDRPFDDSKDNTRSLCKWQFSEMAQDSEVLHDYRLLEILLLERIKQEVYKMDKSAMEQLKKSDVVECKSIYGQVVKYLKQFI